jgi:hypothetical protein
VTAATTTADYETYEYYEYDLEYNTDEKNPMGPVLIQQRAGKMIG